eukprot:SAG25_NODE_12727_length_276_cov_0.581921_1_plen_84_part_01
MALFSLILIGELSAAAAAPASCLRCGLQPLDRLPASLVQPAAFSPPPMPVPVLPLLPLFAVVFLPSPQHRRTASRLRRYLLAVT